MGRAREGTKPRLSDVKEEKEGGDKFGRQRERERETKRGSAGQLCGRQTERQAGQR